MFRGFAYAMAVYVLSSSTPALSENALPNDANANALFVDAVQTYKHAENLPKEQARGKYELVRLYFEQVVAGYPSTNAGRAILSQENPAGVNLQKISFSVDKVGSINATDGAKSVASDILKSDLLPLESAFIS
ncbi:hypothetical protein [Ruegeria sp. HKCCSP335]|uniref:hypothetical protein n=1 Tax=Ruegeria sp. HKCCSP335 TaxID=2794833 RepID=UPI001AEB46A5|nr:hypothetical protein [Ruegeria sp. HKCCSP335]